MATTSTIPTPPVDVPLFDPTTGQINILWANYFLALESLGGVIPPFDARYWVGTSDTELTNEQNLGALTTGIIKITVAAGAATPSVVAQAALTKTDDTNVTLTLGGTPSTALLAATSLTLGWTGLLAVARGGTAADLSATGGTSQVLKQASAGAAVTVGQLASTDITGLASGVYTPTLFNVANLDASTAYQCQYMRVGTVVTVSGKVDVDPTLAATTTQLGISLPVASNFGAAEDCGGTAFASGIAAQGAAILGDLTNDRAQMQWKSGDITNQPMYFSFTYRII